jgi:hypothetical protein
MDANILIWSKGTESFGLFLQTPAGNQHKKEEKKDSMWTPYWVQGVHVESSKILLRSVKYTIILWFVFCVLCFLKQLWPFLPSYFDAPSEKFSILPMHVVILCNPFLPFTLLGYPPVLSDSLQIGLGASFRSSQPVQKLVS